MRAAPPPNQQCYKIGIVCFPTYGGSGVLATELALGLAARGHEVHLFSSQAPVRYDARTKMTFHLVEASDYPLFAHPPYTIALASHLAAQGQALGLDILHAHYAVPHAVSLYLARQILLQQASTHIPKLINTLHGTDVTHIGTAPAHFLSLQLALGASDLVTTPTHFLKQEAYDRGLIAPTSPIAAIPNFIDTARFQPPRETAQEATLDAPPTLVHISNYRPVKRVPDVIEIFARVRAKRAARLLMVGNGPTRTGVEQRAHELGVAGDVDFIDSHSDTVPILQRSHVLLLPSEMESFGLVALEALGCAVPVVASAVGGLPEVIRHGQTGYLAPVGDTAAMATHVLALLDDPQRAQQMGAEGRREALQQWSRDHVVAQYESAYQELLERE